MINRREFLRRCALGSLALSAWGCGTDNTIETVDRIPSDPIVNRVDLAVVGAGMSGLYSAFRALTASRDGWSGLAAAGALKVAVYEADQRVGGRLWSIPTEGIPHIPTEIGGMRILNSQPLINGLVSRLNLPTLPFASGGDNNLYYVRGQRFTTRELLAGRTLPYQLGERERKLDAGDLLALAIGDLVPDAAMKTRAEWLQLKKTLTYQGQPLHDLVFADYLRSRLSPEAFQFAMDGLGYVADFGELNAAEMFQNESEFGTGFTRLVGGYQSLPVRLAEEVRTLGGQVSLGASLRRLRQLGEGFELTFRDGQTVQAKAVILALPPRAISALDPDSVPLGSSQFTSDLQAVSPQKATRLFLAFREPWWAPLGVSAGFSRTDLPLRQCLYFGTEGQQMGADPTNLNSLILATYADGVGGNFWADFLNGPANPYEGAGVPAELRPPRALVEEAVRQLSQLHGVPVPAPYWAAFIDWSRAPQLGAYHFWRPRAKSWEVIPRVGNPLPGLYVTGEAFSTNQGWVEGALDNAEETLQNHLGLDSPRYLTTPYRPANYRALAGVS